MAVAPVTLGGRHVRLEPLGPAHVEGLCAVGLADGVFHWFTYPVSNKSEMIDFVKTALALQDQGVALPFATVDQASGRVVGSTRFGAIDYTNRHVEIGWTWLGRPWQRSALNTEAKLLMLTHAFEVWRCLRVEFKTDRLNTQSRTALARLGAVEEGTFRNHMVCADGRIRDTVWFSVVDRDWPALKANLVARLARG
ncbi:MAG: GNAT family N-acetyltransferase [Azospirillum sp.]|nr:GNAT family N-acetyltransferase [Azospirillum sp.]